MALTWMSLLMGCLSLMTLIAVPAAFEARQKGKSVLKSVAVCYGIGVVFFVGLMALGAYEHWARG